MNKLFKSASAVLAAVMVLSSVGCGDKNNAKNNSIIVYDDSNPYVSTTIDDSTLPTGETVKGEMGKKSTMDKVDITLKKASLIAKIKENANQPKPTDVIVCFFDITNNTDKDISVVSIDNFDLLVDGVISSNVSSLNSLMMAGQEYPDIMSLNSPELAPGESVSGYVAMEAEQEWKQLQVVYRPLKGTNDNSVIFDLTPDMIDS